MEFSTNQVGIPHCTSALTDSSLLCMSGPLTISSRSTRVEIKVVRLQTLASENQNRRNGESAFMFRKIDLPYRTSQPLNEGKAAKRKGVGD